MRSGQTRRSELADGDMQQISPQDSSANTGNTAPLLQSTHDAQTVVVSKKEPLQRGAAGEYIAADAPHWRREPFIPVATEDLGVELAKLPGIQANQFRHAVAKIVRHVTRHDQIRRRRLARCFAPLDPDREVVRIDAEVVGPDQFPKMLKLLDDLLQRAAYTRLAEDEIKGYIGVASAWGVHVHVDFEQLGHWAVYSRGDVCGIRPRRHWRKFWRPVTTEVPLYQRMVVVFEIKPEAKVIGEQLSTGRMHLRLFKNIPKVDIDMLLPSTRPKLTWFDQTKVLVPTIGKVSLSIFKIVRAILLVTIISLHATFSLIVLAVGAIAYIIRGVLFICKRVIACC